MITKTVMLPVRMNAQGMYGLLEQIITERGVPLAPHYTFDFTKLGFIEPVGVTSLANAVELLMASGCKVFFSGMNITSQPILYLDDSRFFQNYLGKTLLTSARVRETTVPIQRVRHEESHAWLDSDFIAWLSYRLKTPAAALASIKMCMQEIFNNIQDHSGRDIGCIFIQHYPNRNQIWISISDFGVGIPNSIRSVLPGVGDPEAIVRACEEGVTSRSVKGNCGVGLDLLIRRVVKANRGEVTIRSGRGHLHCSPARDLVGKLPFASPGFYPGTLIEVKLKTDTFVPDDVEREDLEW